jgi:hypothetical protein
MLFMVQPANGLPVIANKAPVVATHVGSFDANTVERTLERYKPEVHTWLSDTRMGVTHAWTDALWFADYIRCQPLTLRPAAAFA